MQLQKFKSLTHCPVIADGSAKAMIQFLSTYLSILFPNKIEHYLTKLFSVPGEFELSDALPQKHNVACFVRCGKEFKIIEIFYILDDMSFKCLVSFKTNIKKSDNNFVIYQVVQAIDDFFNTLNGYQLVPQVVMDVQQCLIDEQGWVKKNQLGTYKLHCTQEHFTVSTKDNSSVVEHDRDSLQDGLNDLVDDWKFVLSSLKYKYTVVKERSKSGAVRSHQKAGTKDNSSTLSII